MSFLLIKKVILSHPQGANSSSQVLGQLKHVSIILKGDVILYMCNVLASKHDIINKKGSITSPKRCTIIIKANVIQPNPNILKGCMMSFVPQGDRSGSICDALAHKCNVPGARGGERYPQECQVIM
jgi:hypothetical protein